MSLTGISWVILGTALLITFTMSVLHSIVGFAFALLSTPAFFLLFPPKEVVVLTVLLTLVLDVLIVVPSRRAVGFQELRAIALPVLAGLPVGLGILSLVSPPLLKVLVGATVILLATPMLLGWGQRPERGRLLSTVAGFMGGVLTTSINFNGPPVVLYLRSLGLAPHAFRATTAAYLMAAHALAAALFALTGHLTLGVLNVAVVLSVACVAGYWVGSWLYGRIQSDLFARLVLVLVIVMGVVTITSSGYRW